MRMVTARWRRLCSRRGVGFRRRPDEKGAGEFQADSPVVPAVKDNAVTHEKVELGKLLFFDPRLSASEIISCNTCHNLATGGVDAGPTSVGHGWQKGRAARRPSITPSSISPSSGTGAPPT